MASDWTSPSPLPSWFRLQKGSDMRIRIYDNEMMALPNMGIAVMPPPADVLKGLLDQLAPAFTRAMIDARQKLHRAGCAPSKSPLDVLFEVVRAERQRPRAAKHKRAVTKGAARKRVAV